jgi:predicted esterase
MSDMTTARAALLDALRKEHRAERASIELRRRVLARLEAERSGRGRWSELLRRWPSAGALAPMGVVVAVLVAGFVWLRGVPEEQNAAIAVGPEPTFVELEGRASGFVAKVVSGSRPCPRDEVPKGATLVPGDTDFDSRRVGLTVHLLEMRTSHCGTLIRRYLQYVPPSAAGKPNAPIWILLHDTGESAEFMRTEETRWYFDALAEREGFVVVYANAAPGLETDPNVPNSGGWQTSDRSSPHVDDDLYLERVVADVRAQLSHLGAEGPVYLAGRVRGADMALAAAAYRPDLYSGVAAFHPLGITEPPREVRRPRLTRALFVFLGESPGTGGVGASEVVQHWAAALGVPRGMGRSRTQAVLTPRLHVVQQLDYAVDASSGPAARLLVLERASDPFPLPGAYALIDGKSSGTHGAEEAWRFLTGAEEEPDVGDPDIVLENDVVRPPPR